jgi:SHS2 domain-containing protein
METHPPYTPIDHTADQGIVVFGQTQAKLFENAAWALTHLLTDPARLFGKKRKEIEVTGEDMTDLFINFLRELLALFTCEGMFVHSCRIMSLNETRLTAKLGLDPYDSARHKVRAEIKAVTYHGATLTKTEKGHEARVIFDR